MNGVWNSNARIRAIDFAGGTVVPHVERMVSLASMPFLGPRLGFRKGDHGAALDGPLHVGTECFGSVGTV